MKQRFPLLSLIAGKSMVRVAGMALGLTIFHHHQR
jgi:hypothetical protein